MYDNYKQMSAEEKAQTKQIYKNIRKEACWTLSNVTAGTPEQIQSAINAGVFPKLIELLQCSEFDIQKEAAWAVSNATSGGSPEQVLYLAQQNAIAPLCSLLVVADSKVVTVALEGLENILKAAQSAGEQIFNRVASMVNDAGGVASIEELQNHENQAIYARAVKILETYFGAEEESESAIAPEVVSGADGQQQFNFGGGVQPPQQGGFRFG